MVHYVTVEKYSAYVFGTRDVFPDTRRIQCFDNAGRMVARIFFHPGSTKPLPNNTLREEPIFIQLNLYDKDYKDVLDLLRNEKPIIVLYQERGGWIGTSSQEPIGEEESSP